MEQCDRVYVMHEGRIAGELVGDQVCVQEIIRMSFQEKARTRPAGARAGAAGTPRRQGGPGLAGLAGRAVSGRAFLAFLSLVAIFFVNACLNPRILSYLGVQLLFSSAVPLVFVALGQMFMVITGGIDLGNGLSLGLMNVVVAFIVTAHPALGAACSALFVLGYAALAVIIHTTRIPAIVITLGASFIWLGIALLVSPVPGGSAPPWLSAFYNFHFPLVPMPIVLAIAAGLGCHWIVTRSKYGIVINGIGNNPVAVSRSGWSRLVALVAAYSLSGLMVVLGSLMLTVISSSGDCNAARSYCMLSIATIILGGCEFSGGISSPAGVVAAALAISSISFLLTFIGINSNLQSAVTGLILIAALAWKFFAARMEARRWA
jgi:ribose transport system ATP-binding protein